MTHIPLPVAQLDNATDSDSVDRWFESSRADQKKDGTPSFFADWIRSRGLRKRAGGTFLPRSADGTRPKDVNAKNEIESLYGINTSRADQKKDGTPSFFVDWIRSQIITASCGFS